MLTADMDDIQFQSGAGGRSIRRWQNKYGTSLGFLEISSGDNHHDKHHACRSIGLAQILALEGTKSFSLNSLMICFANIRKLSQALEHHPEGSHSLP